MKSFLTIVRKQFVAGFLFLIPVFVIFIIITKAWTQLNSIGTKIAAIFGMKSIVGIGGATIMTSLVLLLICILSGWIVRFSFMKRFGSWVERGLAKYIPGYNTYKEMAEEKLQNKTRELPFKSALVMQTGFWQPAYIVEQDVKGNSVVFLPDIPDTTKGHLLLVSQDQVKMIPSLTANQLDDKLKKMGKGLLIEQHIMM